MDHALWLRFMWMEHLDDYEQTMHELATLDITDKPASTPNQKWGKNERVRSLWTLRDCMAPRCNHLA
jgi:hypothetical protein